MKIYATDCPCLALTRLIKTHFHMKIMLQSTFIFPVTAESTRNDLMSHAALNQIHSGTEAPVSTPRNLSFTPTQSPDPGPSLKHG